MYVEVLQYYLQFPRPLREIWAICTETRADYGNDSNEKRQINVELKLAFLTERENLISASRWSWIMRLFVAGWLNEHDEITFILIIAKKRCHIFVSRYAAVLYAMLNYYLRVILVSLTYVVTYLLRLTFRPLA